MWCRWLELRDEIDPKLIAVELIRRAADVREAPRNASGAEHHTEIAKREDAWRPIALNLAGWSGDREIQPSSTAAAVPDIKTAETWLKSEGLVIRNERFAPDF